jgi:cytochrome d ubiquinol oxidase subunit II
VLGYALLGAGWLVLKSEGSLRAWSRRRIPWLAAAVLAVMFAAFTTTADLDPLARGNLHARPWGLVFTAIGIFALITACMGARWKRDGFPFAMTVLFFLSAFLTLGAMFWPYIIPYRITVGNAAAPDASLSFLFYGSAVILPLVTVYTLRVYWIFRGKIRTGFR